jgi:2-succinyl-6-hydroxy-2,4-cyclohexadiene-1-carboxylate synthase
MRMVFVPGFSQTTASWSSVLAHLPLRSDATAIEIPNAPTFEATADALATEAGPGLWIGYSMGGRLALAAALRHPELVQALVLVSATAGIEAAADRHARVIEDDARATDVEARGVDAFLNDWLTQPMFANVPPNAPGLNERRTLSPAHLAHQLRALGPGVMPSYWGRLHELQIPVLLVSATLDAKFDAVNDRMATLIPAAQRTRIAGGHALAQEAPGALAEAIIAFTQTIRS